MNMINGIIKNMWVIHSLRTTAAAGISLYLARLLSLSEYYWAPISAIIVMQSTFGASWDTSKQRIIGTVLGVLFAGLTAERIDSQLLQFGLGILVLGLICGLLRLTVSAYRFAGVTYAIIILMNHSEIAWRIGMHRFIEVALGIVVALLVNVTDPDFHFPKNMFHLLHLKNGDKP